MDNDSLGAPLDAAALRDGLVGPGLPWRELDVVAETGSTNADLLARAEAGADIDGSVLLAEYQNAGRGRHGRQWSAPPGTQVALSVGVAGAAVPRPGWGWLTLAAGVAVADALAAVGVQAGLKWPNDVLANGGKLAGILAEVAAPQPGGRARPRPQRDADRRRGAGSGRHLVADAGLVGDRSEHVGAQDTSRTCACVSMPGARPGAPIRR